MDSFQVTVEMNYKILNKIYAIVMDLNHKQPGPVDQLEEEHLWYVQKHLRNTRNNIENLNLNNQISLWRKSKESLVI